MQCVTLNWIKCNGSSSGDLNCMGYPYITITPRCTLAARVVPGIDRLVVGGLEYTDGLSCRWLKLHQKSAQGIKQNNICWWGSSPGYQACVEYPLYRYYPQVQSELER